MFCCAGYESNKNSNYTYHHYSLAHSLSLFFLLSFFQRWYLFVGIAYTLHYICCCWWIYIFVNENTRVYISRVKLFCTCMRMCTRKPLEQRWSLCIHRYHLILISRNSEIFLHESKFLFTYLTGFFFGSDGVCTSINKKIFPCTKKLDTKNLPSHENHEERKQSSLRYLYYNHPIGVFCELSTNYWNACEDENFLSSLMSLYEFIVIFWDNNRLK